MPLTCQGKFWLENLLELVCKFQLIPFKNMTLEEQMNAITRLVLLVFIILILFRVKFSIVFLLLSLLFIIIIYYIQSKTMETLKTENYENTQKGYTIKEDPKKNLYKITWHDLNNSRRFCDDKRPLDGAKGVYNNPCYMSVNQKLAGPANPKTLIPPVVVPPITDLDYWKTNNLSTFSQINDETQLDTYRSGYQVSTCCAPTYDCTETCGIGIPSVPYTENFTDNKEEYNDQPYYIAEKQPGDMITSRGYNPEQVFTSSIPSNLPAGNCPRDPSMKQYNENLFTQTIQPGVYTTSQIIEPINSNIGISFTQQFPKTTCKTDLLTGDMHYTQHDPRIIEPVSTKSKKTSRRVTEADIYDPRFTGYGTSYRSYTDENTGQTRFYYDDVDAIRMPNYITRNNIDHKSFGDQYGPMDCGSQNGNINNSNIRALANDAFLTSAIQHRTDLQERLMRKINSEQWQKRSAPIRTTNQRMMGGMRRY